MGRHETCTMRSTVRQTSQQHKLMRELLQITSCIASLASKSSADMPNRERHDDYSRGGGQGDRLLD
jgi:hypothetical protein